MVRIGILGAKGYTAGELMRILVRHPQAELTCLMARVESPEPVALTSPQLRGLVNLPIEPIDVRAMAIRCDVAFLALPHTVAQQYAPGLIEAGVKVVDLSADFRFDSVPTYEKTYGVEHLAPAMNAEIPYALPELFRADIPGAKALAIPGCFPTSVLIALAPFMQRGDDLDLDRIVVNSLTGVSGGGRKPNDAFSLPRVQRVGQGLHGCPTPPPAGDRGEADSAGGPAASDCLYAAPGSDHPGDALHMHDPDEAGDHDGRGARLARRALCQ